MQLGNTAATSPERRRSSGSSGLREGLLLVVAQDDQPASGGLPSLLLGEGYQVHTARESTEALARCRQLQPDLVLLDAAGPGASALDVCREIRAESGAAIIIVSTLASELDTILGLEMGADDYVVKPYRAGELMARVRAVLRRTTTGPQVRALGHLRVGDVRLDVERHEVSVRGQVVLLPLKEFELLRVLLENAGQALSQELLIERLWGPSYRGDPKILVSYVMRLRRRIELDPSCPTRITTVRGIGYRYELTE